MSKSETSQGIQRQCRRSNSRQSSSTTVQAGLAQTRPARKPTNGRAKKRLLVLVRSYGSPRMPRFARDCFAPELNGPGTEQSGRQRADASDSHDPVARIVETSAKCPDRVFA